jgi:transglutaminase-like putative cysteine protease
MSLIRLKFKFQITNKVGNLIFFPIVQTNSYQTISNLTYPKSILKKTEDNLKNKLFVLEGSSTAQLEFDAVLKERNVKIVPTKASLSKNANKYIKKDKYVNGNDPIIKKIAKEIKGNKIDEIIKNSYDFVLDFLDYGYVHEGIYTYSQALRDRITDSSGFAALLCSILNAKAIPTRFVIGYELKKDSITNLISNFPIKSLSFNNLNRYIWLEALLPNNIWFPLDPALEWRRKNGLTKVNGGFGFTPKDRLIISFGQGFKIKYKNKKYEITLLQDPVSVKI